MFPSDEPKNGLAAPLTYWLTGLSGAGKSSLATALARHLRTELCKDLAYSSADRTENMRRAAAVAQLLNRQGITVIAALISPIAAGRAAVKTVIGTEQFIEVHVNTPLAVCQQRDAKGLYARTQKEPSLLLTGMGSLYEPPLAPDIYIDTSQLSLQEAVARIYIFQKYKYEHSSYLYK